LSGIDLLKKHRGLHQAFFYGQMASKKRGKIEWTSLFSLVGSAKCVRSEAGKRSGQKRAVL